MNTEGSKVGRPRGFAALTPERRREISRKGGVTAHVKGSAHEWDSVSAREAGRKGGLSHSARRAATIALRPRTMEAGPPADGKREAS